MHPERNDRIERPRPPERTPLGRLDRLGAKLGVMNWIAVALIVGALLVGLFTHH